MTFFPEPLKPSEGRKDDELRVERIEADKQGGENQEWDTPSPNKPNAVYSAFLVMIDKLSTFFGREKERAPESLSEDSLANGIQSLKGLFQILMTLDQSSNSKFSNELSETWLQLSQDLQVFSRTKQKALVDIEKLRSLVTDIDHYPPNEDHKLGYYLSSFAGEKWLPVPFQEILKHLYTDHQINKQHSTLTRWVDIINDLLQS